MFSENLVWQEKYEDCYLLIAGIRFRTIGLGYAFKVEDDKWYYKGDDGLGNCIEGYAESLVEAMELVENHVDLTSY